MSSEVEPLGNHRTTLGTIQKIIVRSEDIDTMLGEILDVALAAFDGDRAFLLTPCDPDAPSWSVRIERTKPQYPGAFAEGLNIPTEPDVANTFRVLLHAAGPITFGEGNDCSLPTSSSDQFGFVSFMSMALRPRGDQPWQFGIHQCSGPRKWSDDERELLREIGERISDGLSVRSSLHQLQLSNQKLQLALTAGQIGTFELNFATMIAEWSEETSRIWDLPGTHSGEVWNLASDRVRPDYRERVLNAVDELATAEGEGSARFPVVWTNGETHWLQFTAKVVNDPASGGETLLLGVSMDVTEQRKRRQMMQMLIRLNSDLMHAHDEADLLQHMCDTVVEVGQYSLAWVGVDANVADGIVDIANSAGPAKDYLYEAGVSSARNAVSGQGPVGVAMRSGTAQVVNDIFADPLFEPWRESAAHYGIASCIAIPFTIGMSSAVLCLYSRDKFAFEESVVESLIEIASEFGFGVDHVRSVQNTETALAETIVAVNALRETEHALTESEQRFRLAFEGNMAPMSFSDLEDQVIAVNDAFCELTGFSREELIGRDSKPFTYAEDLGITEANRARLLSGEVDQERYVKRYVRKDGRLIVVEVSRSPARDVEGRAIYLVSSERDVTEERALNAQLTHQALHDSLTGLANRALFEDRLSQAQVRAARNGGLGAVLLLDLDDFKGVNDAHSHLVGDQLLVAIAQRFTGAMRASDTLGRPGGDEFLYLAEDLNSPDEAEQLAMRLLDVLAEPFSIAGVEFEQHASIGVVVWDEAASEPAELIRDADVALYEAKNRGKGHYVVFQPSMQQQAIGRFVMVHELQHALAAGALSMHYQPIVDLTSTEIVGFEALMRWRHPDLGWVSPSVFIPLAEKSGLILELGSFALHEAVVAASTWVSTGALGLRPYVTVNLSARQFHEPKLVSMIEEVLAMNSIAPERLIIEITESVMLRDASETGNVIGRLQKRGVDFALDDFGTGYSSLSYLAALHPRIIKIDQSFVRPTHDEARIDTLLETIISLGSKLGITTLAEGIETPEQLQHLRRLGCELGQGYLFSPAVTGDEVARMLEGVAGNWHGEDWHYPPRLTDLAE